MIDSYDGVDYSLWPIFGGVEEYFLKDIILLHIFGNTGNSAIFVTKDDEVYAVGENVAGFLGIGEIERTGSPIRLDLLCGKHVQGFASGTTHSVAYTREGELYSWGDNNLGKLGNGTIICRDSPGRVLLPEGVKVIQAACADRYSAAITSEFKVLHWGDIEWSNGTSQTLPSYLQFPENVRIFNLCCGAFHAVALSSDSQVYTWGCGDMGQLGHRRISDVEMIPRLVEGQLTGLLIKEITCTMLASVVLTLDGRVYAWGHNRDGVLGLAMDIETIPTPQQVKIEEEYIKSIAAANMGSIITAVSETNVYKWGMDETRIGVFISKVDKVSWNVPYTVQVNNILNAFASSPIPRSNRITLEKIRNNLKEEKNLSLADDGIVLRDIGNALYNNKEYSDLTLRLSDGVVYVHKLILCSFCEHFKSMLDGPWAENGKKEIDLTRYNPQAYRAFVKYIYTGKLDQTLNGSQLIELCDIAESYFENDLKRMVITKFPSCLTEENVAELYCTAYSQPCEVDSHYCSNCMEHLPSAEARLKKNRCSTCFDCPNCFHPLSVRATMRSAEDGSSKSTPTKRYYLSCFFCRWTTRDVNIQDQTVAAGNWPVKENPYSELLTSYLEYYKMIAMTERSQKEKKTYGSLRKGYTSLTDKYGLTAMIARKRAGLPSLQLGGKDFNQSVLPTITPCTAVEDIEPLPESFYTEVPDLTKVTTLEQRHANPMLQTEVTSVLHPQHRHFYIKRSLRCRKCEHNVSKPEYNPGSIKFKIQLAAYYHMPEVRIMTFEPLVCGKPSEIILKVTNPTQHLTSLQFGDLVDKDEEDKRKVALKEQIDDKKVQPILVPKLKRAVTTNTKVELPNCSVILPPRDDAAEYDDTGDTHNFQDDPKIVVWRKGNKAAIKFVIIPDASLPHNDKVIFGFSLEYGYVNTMPTLEQRQPQRTEMQVNVYITPGAVSAALEN